MSDPTATARRSVADRKNSSGLKRSAADRKNSSRPKPDRQLRRSAADRKPKSSLFGTDSLQCSALAIHDHYQLVQHPLDMAAPMAGFHLVVCADPAPTGIMTMRRYRCLKKSGTGAKAVFF